MHKTPRNINIEFFYKYGYTQVAYKISNKSSNPIIIIYLLIKIFIITHYLKFIQIQISNIGSATTILRVFWVNYVECYLGVNLSIVQVFQYFEYLCKKQRVPLNATLGDQKFIKRATVFDTNEQPNFLGKMWLFSKNYCITIP